MLTAGYLDYLITNRSFTAPAVAAAIGSDMSDHPARVLDAGTGAGGALPGLVDLVRGGTGQAGTVVAVDIDPQAVEVARRQLGDLRLEGATVDLRVADLRDVTARAEATGERFDVIWSSDVIWPSTFDDPVAVIETLAGATVVGGTLALFTANHYQSMFLPGWSRLERLIRTASELAWGLPGDGPTHHERLGAWMRRADLTDVTLRVFPVAAAASTRSRTCGQRSSPGSQVAFWQVALIHADLCLCCVRVVSRGVVDSILRVTRFSRAQVVNGRSRSSGGSIDGHGRRHRARHPAPPPDVAPEPRLPAAVAR